MSDAAREPTDGFELLSLPELLFELFLGSDIADIGARELGSLGLKMFDGDLHGDESPITRAAGGLQPYHFPCFRLLPGAAPGLGPDARVDVPDAHLKQLCRGVSHQTTGSFVDIDESAVLLGPEDGFRRLVDREERKS
jgi:hypothetical protein